MPSCLRPVSNRKAAPKPQKAEYMGKYRRFGSSHSARLLQRQPGLPRFFMAACLCSIGIRQFCSCGSHEPFAPKKVAPPMLGRATEPAFIRLFFISAVLHLHVHAAVERIGDTGISADDPRRRSRRTACRLRYLHLPKAYRPVRTNRSQHPIPLRESRYQRICS